MSKWTKTMRDALTEMSEAFSKKQIKMAIGIASDPRYKQGNYSGAVRQIEKLKKGLSDHPQVAAVLKRQNEEILEKVKCPDCEGAGCPKCEDKGYITDAVDKEDEPFLKDLIKNLRKGSATHGKQADDLEKAVNEADFKPHMMYDPKTGKGYKAEKEEDHLRMKDMGYTHEKPEVKEDLDEAKFSDGMIDKLKKAYEPMKGKKINPTPLMKIFDKIDSNKDGLEQLYKADIPFVSMMAMSRLMLKHNYKADDINKLGKIRREDFVFDEAINEGTWHIPDSPKLKSGLKKLMSKPIKLGKEGDDAVDVIGKFIGDDELYDDLYVAGKKNPNGDARDVIKKAMKRLDIKEETELDEGMAYKFAAVDKKGLVIGFASDEKDAKDMARRNKGRVVTLTKPLAPKKGDMMVNRPFPDEMDKFPTNTSATQGKRMEEVELDELKMNDPKLNKVFDKLKPKATVQLKTSSTIAKGDDFKTYLVVSKNTLRNGVEKITLKNRANPTGVKSFLYRRDGKVTFAIGDMGASIDDIKESTNEVPENMAAYLAAITKQLGEK